MRAPTPPRRMSSRDAGFLYLERPHALLHIGCVAVIEGTLPRAALIACLEVRLPRLRRYTQRATPVPLALGHPPWEDDPEFSLHRHMKRWALPSPGGEAELREAVEALLGALDEAPAPLVALLGSALRVGRLANVIATNVPGPHETRWLAGQRVEALYPIVPITDGIGLGLAVFSYDGWLHVGLDADAGLLPDLEKLRHGIETAFERLATGC